MKKTDNIETEDTKKSPPILNENCFTRKDTDMQFIDPFSIYKNQETIINLLEKRIKYDDTKEKAFCRLYDELDAVKHDKEFQKIKPLYLDLILLYDRVNLLKTEGDMLASVCDELLEILSRQNIEIINNTESKAFDLSLQKVVGTQTAEEEKLDSKVVQVLRDGFICDNKVLRAQEVIIGKYIKPSEEASDDK